jgi:ribosomal protein S14
MKKYRSPLLYLCLIVAVLVIAALNRKPAPELSLVGAPVPMAIPVSYRENFSLYLVVDRPDATVRHIYVHPDTIVAIQAGEGIPYGTQVVIEAYHAQKDVFGIIQRDENGHYLAGEMFPQIHMMEKRDDWTVDDLPSPIGVIDWNFASFNTDSYLPSTENRNDCMTCHDANAFRRDFVISRVYLENYAATGEAQYLYCNLPDRANCIR